MNKEELAWAAGFFDGEGYVSCITHPERKNLRVNRLRLSMAQVDRRVLDRFRSAVGLGKIYGPYNTHGGNKRPIFHYQIGRPGDILAVVALIYPYLSPVKKEQCENALSVYGRSNSPEVIGG